MSKKALLIAEKPDLMRKIKSAYNNMQFPDRITFTSVVGHALQLKYPGEYNKDWEKWDLETLPMIPDNFTYNVKDKRSFDIIKKEIESGKYDYIINAGDPEREGQLIVRELLIHLNCKLPVKRLWLNDLKESTIQKELMQMQDDNSPKFKALEHAALLRSYFDWLIGMNFSRAITINTGTTIGIGRVMTPTLKIIVDREEEITNFVSEEFFEIFADYKEGFTGKWFHKETNGTRFKKEASAKSLIDKLTSSKEATITKLEKKQTLKHPYGLHDLAQLQIEANNVYGYTPTETLNIAQELYQDLSVLSYPRTDSRHITKAIAKDIPAQLEAFKDMDVYGDVIKEVLKNPDAMNKALSNKRFVNDAKVSDHYGIIPTDIYPDFSKFTKDQKNIYLLVFRRFIGMFLKPEVTERTEVIADINGEYFKTIGNVLVDEGFMRLYKSNKKNNMLPDLKEGQKLSINELFINKGKTTPPKRYTLGGLTDVMDNIGRLIEDKDLKLEKLSIGTAATTGSIIDKLIQNKMIKNENNVVSPTDFGNEIISAIGNRDIASPELTAEWEKKLRNIETENMSAKEFYNEMIEYICNTTEDFKVNVKKDLSKYNTKKNNSKYTKEVIGNCPKCDKEVILFNKAMVCSDKECGFFMSRNIAGAKITKTDLKKMLKGEESKEYNFKFKSGKTGQAKLNIKKDGGLNFNFSNKK